MLTVITSSSQVLELLVQVTSIRVPSGLVDATDDGVSFEASANHTMSDLRGSRFAQQAPGPVNANQPDAHNSAPERPRPLGPARSTTPTEGCHKHNNAHAPTPLSKLRKASELQRAKLLHRVPSTLVY